MALSARGLSGGLCVLARAARVSNGETKVKGELLASRCFIVTVREGEGVRIVPAGMRFARAGRAATERDSDFDAPLVVD